MPEEVEKLLKRLVAPCAGAWVEIFSPSIPITGPMSLPVRERGMKLGHAYKTKHDTGRSLCGSVG